MRAARRAGVVGEKACARPASPPVGKGAVNRPDRAGCAGSALRRRSRQRVLPRWFSSSNKRSGLLGSLVGDVEYDADDACGLAFAVGDHLAAIHHPAHVPVTAADAVLELVLAFRSTQDLLLALPRRLAVVGMDEVEARLEGRRSIGLTRSEDLQELRRAQRAIAGDIVSCTPNCSALGRSTQLRFAPPQRRRPLLDVAPAPAARR